MRPSVSPPSGAFPRPSLTASLAAGLLLSGFLSLTGPARAEDLPAPGPVPDFTAPGYALGPRDLPYQGFGTHPAAPAPDASLFDPPEKKPPSARNGIAGPDPEPLRRLLTLRRSSSGGGGNPPDGALRSRALREAAVTLGFQRAVRYRYGGLCDEVRARARIFDRVFAFRQLLIAGRVLPPVLLRAGPSVRLQGSGEAAMTEESYLLSEPARVVSRAPDWRDYLLMSFEAFEARDPLLPENAAERALWEEAVRAGWRDGLRQAEEVFRLNMARLSSDFRGMLRFRLLERLGMVSMPGLAEGRLGVRAGARSLHVNERDFSITLPAAFRE